MFDAVSKVLVLAPHTDDGELGVGGTIARMVSQNITVYYAAFSTAEASVPEGMPPGILKSEVVEATSELGIHPDHLFIYDYEVRKLGYRRQEILEQLIQLRETIAPDLVFLPSLHDIHQDHSALTQEGIRAFKNCKLLGYELIWNNLSFDTECFVQLEQEHVRAKANALKAYRSQRHRNYMSEEFIFALAKTRGVQIGASYAEAFEVIRWII